MNVKFGILTATVMTAAVAFAESREVATPAEFKTALEELTETDDEIVLTADSYDVGALSMTGENSLTAHLYAKGCKIRSRTTDPRGTVIYGNHTKCVLLLNGGAAISGVTVSNGYNTAFNGAGVRSYSTSCVVSNCVITCSDGPGKDCGGVSNTTCYDTEICYNTANYGAGSQGGSLVRCHVHHNKAASQGGGCFTSSLRNCLIENNEAKSGGGGLSSNTDKLWIYDTYIVSNRATGGNGGGGLSRAANLRIVFTNCVFACNSASNNYGGGVASSILWKCVVSNNCARSGGGTFDNEIHNSTIVDNFCVNSPAGDVDYGGGGSRKDKSIEGSVISGNVALYYGGGIHDALNVHHSTVSGNRIVKPDDDKDAEGAGIFRGTVSNCVICGNSCLNPRSYGGGVARVDLYDSTVSNNLAYKCGGGVSQGTVSNCTIVGNAATGVGIDAAGGALYNATAYASLVRDNFSDLASAMQGGAAYGTTFANNPTTYNSGSYTFRSVDLLRDCTIEASNIAEAKMLLNCRVTGGGRQPVLAEGANAWTSGTFKAAATLLTAVSATNCLFYGNQRLEYFLHSTWSSSGTTAHLSSCTFAGNDYAYICAGFPGSKNSTLVIENCIFSDNRNRYGTDANAFTLESPASETQIRFRNNLVSSAPDPAWQPAVYESVITNRARFYLSGSDPYQLGCSSRARGKAIVYDWMATANDVRGEGYPRLDGGRADLGCYQCYLEPKGLMIMVQ